MVEIARHYRGDEARQEECLNKIMSASGFLLELVNNVLDMNKLESGEVQLENKPFDVCDLVEETAVIIEAQTVEKNPSRISKEIHHDGYCHVVGSPLHVRQVLPKPARQRGEIQQSRRRNLFDFTRNRADGGHRYL